MAITKKTTAKAHDGLASRLQKLQKAHERRDRDRDTVQLSALRSAPTLGQKASRVDRVRRLQRLHDSILGPNPTFPGNVIIPKKIEAQLEDATRVQDIKHLLQSGAAQVYWVDGSERDGFLGAGVVWYEDDRLVSGSYQLGPSTAGNNCDAELFALAAALGRARKHVQKGNELARVRIFSDAREILIRIKNGNCHTFGPLLAKKTALEGLYARAQWLKAHNVCIELMWVKGHSNSEGNQLADQAAYHAVLEQAVDPPAPVPFFSTVKTELDVPIMWRNLGQDWVDEWLWRANHAHAVTLHKQAELMGRQTYGWQVSQNRNAWQQTLIFLRQRDGSPALEGSPDGDVARHLNSATEEARPNANEVLDFTSLATADARAHELSRLRHELQTLLAALNEREKSIRQPIRTTAALYGYGLPSKPSNTAELIWKAVKLEQRIRIYQLQLASGQDLKRKENLEQKRLKAAIDRPCIFQDAESSSIKTLGIEAGFEQLRVQDPRTASADEADGSHDLLTKAWVGDALFHILGSDLECETSFRD